MVRISAVAEEPVTVFPVRMNGGVDAGQQGTTTWVRLQRGYLSVGLIARYLSSPWLMEKSRKAGLLLFMAGSQPYCSGIAEWASEWILSVAWWLDAAREAAKPRSHRNNPFKDAVNAVGDLEARDLCWRPSSATSVSCTLAQATCWAPGLPECVTRWSA